MPSTSHQTTPFRRPMSTWLHDGPCDPAAMGTEYGLELSLAHRNAGEAATMDAAASSRPAPDAAGYGAT